GPEIGEGFSVAGFAGWEATVFSTGAAAGRRVDSPASEDACVTGASLSLEESIFGIPLPHYTAADRACHGNLSRFTPWPSVTQTPPMHTTAFSGGNRPTNARDLCT